MGRNSIEELKVRRQAGGDIFKEILRAGEVVTKRAPNARKEYRILQVLNKEQPDLCVPKAISYVDGVLTMSFLSGRHIDFERDTQESIDAQIAAMADCLVSFHNVAISPDLTSLLEKKYSTIAENILGRFSEHLSLYGYDRDREKNEKKLRWLQRQCLDLSGTAPQHLVHGDYCHPQVLVNEGAAATYDLETAYIGFVEDDLARFVSKVALLGLLSVRSKIDIDRAEQVFLDRYEEKRAYDRKAFRLLTYVYLHRLRLREKDTANLLRTICNRLIFLNQKKRLQDYRLRTANKVKRCTRSS